MPFLLGYAYLSWQLLIIDVTWVHIFSIIYYEYNLGFKNIYTSNLLLVLILFGLDTTILFHYLSILSAETVKYADSSSAEE